MCQIHESERIENEHHEGVRIREFINNFKNALSKQQILTLTTLNDQNRISLASYEMLPKSWNPNHKTNVAVFKFRLEDMELTVRF